MNVKQLQSEINSAYQNLRFNNKKLLGFLEQLVVLLDFDFIEEVNIREAENEYILVEIKKIEGDLRSFQFWSEVVFIDTKFVTLHRCYDFINNTTLCVRNFIKEFV